MYLDIFRIQSFNLGKFRHIWINSLHYSELHLSTELKDFFRGRVSNRVPLIGRISSQPILQLSWISYILDFSQI
jgi:hypothetical protein